MEVDKERGRISLSVKALGAESDLVIPESAFDTGGQGGFNGTGGRDHRAARGFNDPRGGGDGGHFRRRE